MNKASGEDMMFDEYLTEIVHIIGREAYEFYTDVKGFSFKDCFDDSVEPFDAAFLAREVCGTRCD